MKKIISLTFLAAIIFLFYSCFKENHKIRFRNDYATTIFNAAAGSASFGSVPSGSVSDFQSISTGNFNISGTTNTGRQLTGSGAVSGKGTHKWTITISTSGHVGIEEDK